MLRRLARVDDAGSLSSRLRSARFRAFERMTAELPRPLHILDVGGTNNYWQRVGWAGRPDVEITILNHAPEPRVHANVTTISGDATDLSRFDDGSIDIVFSNSVIEHLFTDEAQRRMAAEVQRVGRAYWVQTPNYWFPVEPHFLWLGWQWLPRSVRIAILRRRRCGWRGPLADAEAAARAVDEVRLLSRRRLEQLFPAASLRAERIGPLVKSWTAHEGLER